MTEVTDQHAKYLFGVINLPKLQNDLVCGPFTIRSRNVSEGAMDAFGDTGEETGELVTADGEYLIPAPLPGASDQYHAFANEAYQGFSRRAEILDLLLSFAHRRHIQVWNPHIYVREGDEWRYRGGGSIYPSWDGPRRGKPWYVREVDLEAFMQRAYARMVDEFNELRGGEQRRGLRLALLALSSARSGGVGEIQYLRAWSALEILVNYSDVRQFAVTGSQFGKRFKPQVEAAIDGAAASQAVAEDMKAKIPDLNRRSIVRRTTEFLGAVLPLDQYPQH